MLYGTQASFSAMQLGRFGRTVEATIQNVVDCRR